MTHKEFYNWTKQYLGARLESEKIEITPIVEKLGEVNNKNNMEHRININGEWYVKENTQKKHQYKLGDKFNLEFDYDGMLEWGMNITMDTSINDMEKLLDSLEDVNYHREAAPLYDLIDQLKYINEYGPSVDLGHVACGFFKRFKKEIKDTINNSNGNG